MTPLPLARSVEIASHGDAIHGDLVLPEGGGAMVVFAHGSGSSRHSPRTARSPSDCANRAWAPYWSTCSASPRRRWIWAAAGCDFDIDLLAGRLVGAVAWLDEQQELRHLRLGYFGASTAPLPRWWRRHRRASASVPSCLEVGAPTWRARRFLRCRRRPCSSWAVTTRRS